MHEREKARALGAYHVAGARLGDAGDFAALVALFDARLRAHARRLCDDAETARDIAQEAWLTISRSLGALRDDHAFLAWALRITTRIAARDLGRRIRQREAVQGFGESLADDPVPEGDALRAAIATLPAHQRAALALFYLEEMSVAEVAVALDIPSGTVKTRLMHARNRLRAQLEGQDHGQT
ncbi:MAG: RNA polymerase sigma factor [Pararhodobacter sp.]